MLQAGATTGRGPIRGGIGRKSAENTGIGGNGTWVNLSGLLRSLSEDQCTRGTVNCSHAWSCHSPARVGCFWLRPRALPPFPSDLSASPPDSRAGSQALPPRPSAAGGRGAKRAAACHQARCRRLMSAPCPQGTETRSGVGRVARRARLAAKLFFRPLPCLTLKAGHKAGLPTTPPLAAALRCRAFFLFFSQRHFLN